MITTMFGVNVFCLIGSIIAQYSQYKAQEIDKIKRQLTPIEMGMSEEQVLEACRSNKEKKDKDGDDLKARQTYLKLA